MPVSMDRSGDGMKQARIVDIGRGEFELFIGDTQIGQYKTLAGAKGRARRFARFGKRMRWTKFGWKMNESGADEWFAFLGKEN